MVAVAMHEPVVIMVAVGRYEPDAATDEDGVADDSDIAVARASDCQVADTDGTGPEPHAVVDVAGPVPDTIADEDGVAGNSDIAIPGARDGDIADTNAARPVPDAVAEAVAPGRVISTVAAGPEPAVITAVAKPVPEPAADEDGEVGRGESRGRREGAGDGQVTEIDGAGQEPVAGRVAG